MPFSKKNLALLYIDKNKGEFFTNAKAKPKQLNLPEEAFSNLEVIDSQKLEEFIEKFLENNKIEPSELLILLSEETIFEKDITDIPKTEKYIEIQKFLDIVPFEETISKVFKIQKKEKIIAANGQFCQKLIQILNAKEFRVSAIIPLSIFGKVELPSLLKKIDTIKKYNLLSYSDTQETPSPSTNSSQNNRLIILISIFVILLLILGIFVYIVRNNP